MQPQSMPCKFHNEINRPIDEEATKLATSNSRHKLTAGYLPCSKCVQEAANQKLQEFGVPRNLIHATFDNFIPSDEFDTSHVEVVKSFCENPRGFLILLGGVGTGKSHLATAALRSIGRGWFIKQASLLRALRASYIDSAAPNPIGRAMITPIFVLDDVGLSGGGRDELPMLHEILDHRHGERLPTVITSNLEYESLTKFLGERMADRLRESVFRVLIFAGNSHRPNARERYFDATPIEPPRRRKNQNHYG